MSENVELNDIHVEFDVGNLCVTNIALLNSNKSNYSESLLKQVAALGAQKLWNEVIKLPSEYHDDVPVVKLPEPTTVIPREKRLPERKPETKWQKFARSKGIQNKKKDKLVWDKESKEWKPRYGYRGVTNKKDWMLEVPEHGDPDADYFGDINEKKKERVAKNEYQRLRNIAVASKEKVRNMESVNRANKQQLLRSVGASKAATASLGRYTDSLPQEKAPRNSMKKRQFKPNIQKSSEEKSNNLRILESIEKKQPKLNVQEAVQRYIMKPLKEQHSEEQKESARMKKTAKKNKVKKNTFRSKNNPKNRKNRNKK